MFFMAQREIHAPAGGKCAERSRFRLFGRRILEKLSGESRELSELRKLMYALNHAPSKSRIKEIRELGSLFRSLSAEERTPLLELKVFYCLSRIRVCCADPVLRGVAETERRITDWKIREAL